MDECSAQAAHTGSDEAEMLSIDACKGAWEVCVQGQSTNLQNLGSYLLFQGRLAGDVASVGGFSH